MWGQVGVIRSGESLIRACAQLALVAARRATVFSAAALEVKNMVQVAQCVAEAALWRENSIGAHYRSDFPQAKRPGWQQAQPAVDGGWNRSGATEILWTSAGAEGAGRVTGRSVITPSRTRKVR